MTVRNFTAPSAPSMQDIVKDLYVSRIRSYKPAPDAKGADASSQVKDFKAPLAPVAPAIDAAGDLEAWEKANVEDAGTSDNNLVEEEDDQEEDEDEEDDHHH